MRSEFNTSRLENRSGNETQASFLSLITTDNQLNKGYSIRQFNCPLPPGHGPALRPAGGKHKAEPRGGGAGGGGGGGAGGAGRDSALCALAIFSVGQ